MYQRGSKLGCIDVHRRDRFFKGGRYETEWTSFYERLHGIYKYLCWYGCLRSRNANLTPGDKLFMTRRRKNVARIHTSTLSIAAVRQSTFTQVSSCVPRPNETRYLTRWTLLSCSFSWTIYTINMVQFLGTPAMFKHHIDHFRTCGLPLENGCYFKKPNMIMRHIHLSIHHRKHW